jgi:hypothetical protein
VILHRGKYLCVLCGDEVGISADQRPLVTIETSGGRSNMRSIMLGDEEVHACPMGTAWDERSQREDGELS